VGSGLHRPRWSDCDLAYWLSTRRGWLCLTMTGGRVGGIGYRAFKDYAAARFCQAEAVASSGNVRRAT
jgi:hypothetical protein